MIVPNSPHHILELWADFACFTRPEMKVERYSYPCPTPSAARGALEAIYFKPQFFWQVRRIELLAPPSYIALRRNEVKDKLNATAAGRWMAGKEAPEPIWADADKGLLGTDQKGRTQRQTMALRDPRFRVTAQIVPRPGHEAKQKSFDEQFVRRASQGKCFQQPYLGCREFVAFFRYVPALDDEPEPCDYSQDLGWMLYDTFDLHTDNHAPLVDKRDPSQRKPGGWKKIAPSVSVFRARVEHGVLEVPAFDSPEVRKPDDERRSA